MSSIVRLVIFVVIIMAALAFASHMIHDMSHVVQHYNQNTADQIQQISR